VRVRPNTLLATVTLRVSHEQLGSGIGCRGS
jgi:hypothetical protein